MAERFKRWQTTTDGNAGSCLQKVAALLKIFEIHNGDRLALDLEFWEMHGKPQRTFDAITFTHLPV